MDDRWALNKNKSNKRLHLKKVQEQYKETENNRLLTEPWVPTRPCGNVGEKVCIGLIEISGILMLERRRRLFVCFY